jgi:membrane-associated phospholipid phosphatase
MNIIADFISLTILPTFVLPWFISVKFGICMVMCEVSILMIHTMLSKSSYKFLKRPHDACNCNLFNSEGNWGGAQGFPSGHVSNAMCFVTLLWLKYNSTSSPFFIISGLLWVAAMCWARLEKHCHTKTQVVAGIVYGFLFATCFTKFFGI